MIYEVKAGETLSGIAQKYQTTVAQLVKLNKLSNPDKLVVGQKLKLAQSNSKTKKTSKVHIVKAGETLSGIAQKYQTTVAQLVKLNKLSNPDKLAVGQKLKLAQSASKPKSDKVSKPNKVSTAKQLITKKQLQQIGWKQVKEELVVELNECLRRFSITTPKRMRHFISQCSHESGAGKWRLELASGKAYEGRRDLGNTRPGDGVKFKGAGFIQMTGRANYEKFAKFTGDSKIVQQGAVYVAKKYPWLAAGYWWHQAQMNKLCDQNASVEQVTRRVNGGYNGLAERKSYYNKCLQVIK